MFAARPPTGERPGTAGTPRSRMQATGGELPERSSHRFSRLHPATAEKFRIHWRKVGTAFHAADENKDGRLTADELKGMLRKVNVLITSDEFRDIWDCFDADRSGSIDYQEFQSVMADILEGNLSHKKEFAETNGVSLNIKGPCSIVDPKRAPLTLDTAWNNRYRQLLHSNGEPFVAATVSGAWYFEDREKRFDEVTREKSGKSFFPPQAIQQWDKEANRPEMASIMTGRFYGDESRGYGRSMADKARLKKWVTTNRRMTKDYSNWLRNLVEASRPSTAPPNSARSGNSSTAAMQKHFQLSGTSIGNDHIEQGGGGDDGAGHSPVPPNATTSASPRLKRTRLALPPGGANATATAIPIRQMAQDDVAALRQSRAEEYLRAHRPQTAGALTDRTPRPPLSARGSVGLAAASVPSFNQDLQLLQRSAYRCRWASPRVDTLQKARTKGPIGVSQE